MITHPSINFNNEYKFTVKIDNFDFTKSKLILTYSDNNEGYYQQIHTSYIFWINTDVNTFGQFNIIVDDSVLSISNVRPIYYDFVKVSSHLNQYIYTYSFMYSKIKYNNISIDNYLLMLL